MKPSSRGNKPHNAILVVGIAAVDAYDEGEIRSEVLKDLGSVHHVEFHTPQELDAFMQGVELCRHHFDAIILEEKDLK